MKTETIKIYQFNELDGAAKEKAIEGYRNGGNDFEFYSDEWKASLDAFCDVASIEWREFDAANGTIYYTINLDDEVLELEGIRAVRWLYNNLYSDLVKGKYYSTPGEYIDGKYNYKFRHSKIQKEWDNCPLTGTACDFYLVEPVMKFMAFDAEYYAADKTVKDILDECMASWAKGLNEDYEYRDSDEAIRETIEANDYEFLASGERY